MTDNTEKPTIDQQTQDQEESYRPCKDDKNPICRNFINRGKCKKGNRCRFYHPEIITESIKKKAKREPGCCYCGARQRTFVNNRLYRQDEGNTFTTFFVVCGRTGKSMKKCMGIH